MVGEIQLGKQGVTENFIKTLQTYFVKNKVVKISVLQALSTDKKEIKKLAEEISEKLSGTFDIKLIGHKIILRRRGNTRVKSESLGTK
jgi:RNA-binding protein YhbY